ncbi:tRNA threonylcarbamoyladenosine dehydratase [Desulfolucanica intricata]|uniref:tRNA threonylcarbamoyladenosine dehydratase n=1 Tax=Desulfolucanica intricata TaxID=1285191 RepID=UPI000833E7EE|nr:tRNA threonylcarbamoyladenosine dehydratase [Desulfolucanica intricata]
MHRFSRTEFLIGAQGLKTLSNSKVAVFGVGGVGSFAVEALARAGIGSLFLMDFDVVDITNINRQLHALNDTIGEAKVDLMFERVKKINPKIQLSVVKDFYSAEQGEKFFREPFDYVIDAIDYIPGKLDLIIRCLKNDIRIISAMGAGNKLDPTRFRVADISETSVCPLARIIRRELRKAGFEKGLKVVFSTEVPIKPQYISSAADSGDISGKCVKQVPGSISFVPSVMGLIIAGTVINDLLKNNA